MEIPIKIAWVLGVALIGSNIWWIHATKVEDIRCAETIDQRWSSDSALVQAVAVLPIAASQDATKQSVVKRALEALPGVSADDHGERVNVGALILQFDGNGRVIAAEPLSAAELAKSYSR